MDHSLDRRRPPSEPPGGDAPGALPAAAEDRKLPVLFHLVDVSRPRARTSAVQPVDLSSATPVPAAVNSKSELELELSLAPLPPLPPLPAFPTAPVLPLLDTAPLSALPPPPAMEVPPELPRLSEPDSIASPTPAATEATLPQRDAAKPETPPVEIERPVSLPPKRQLGHRAKPAAADDWFAAHGKFIAVAFVLALIGTVYFARTTRRPARQEEAVRPVAPLIELASASESSAPAAAPATSAPALTASTTPAAAPVTPATVELHMPTAPAASVAAKPEAATSGDSLFVFPASKPSEAQIAGRPEITATNSPATSASLPASVTMPPAYPATGSPPISAPSSMASYPQTTAPPLAATGPPGAYQSMTPPAGPPLPATSPAAHYGPATYQSPDNVARGPRHERIGSGNYEGLR